MKKKYLVTGGTGFIGAALVRGLLNEGHDVRIFDNNSRGSLSRLNGIENSIEIVEGDIRNLESVLKAAEGIDSILHLAFINGTEYFYSKPELVLDVGIRGMLNVLDACKANGVKELVLASSSEVYQTPPIIPTDEDAPLSIPDVLNPRYSYAGGKLISELMAVNYGRSGFERVMIFRPHNVYGPNMGNEHVLPQFVRRMLEAKNNSQSAQIDFQIQGDGSSTRAFIHIDDFVAGVIQMLKKGQHLNLYHIGNPEEIAIRDVANQVAKLMGCNIKIVAGPDALGATQRRCPNISKMNNIGFYPKITFSDGLKTLVDWYVDHINSEG